MSWRPAKSLLTLRAQIDELAPNRNKASDGLVGDAAHASRTSDHNPWVTDGAMGVVTALDITHDPANGVDAGKLAEILRASGDRRIKYIISNKRIANPGQPWRAYTGANPHTLHFHVSVKSTKADYDSEAPWKIGDLVPDAGADPVRIRPTLRLGSVGEDVRFLQRQLKTTVDGHFGVMTEAAVKAFQAKNGLPADGICGAYTWEAVERIAGKAGVPVRTTKPVTATAKNSRTVFGALAAMGATVAGYFQDAVGVVLDAAKELDALAPAAKVAAALGMTPARVTFAIAVAALAMVIFARLDDARKGNVK